MSISTRPWSVFFACTTVVCALVAWHHYRARLQAFAPKSGSADHRLVERLHAAEARAEKLAYELAAMRRESHAVATEEATVLPTAPSTVASGPTAADSSSAPHRDPRPLTEQVERAYSPLLQSLGLPPEQARTFERLLLNKQQTLHDLRSIAGNEGIDARTNVAAMRILIRSTQRETEEQIASLLGPAAYARYQQFQKNLPLREVTDRLRQTLTFVGATLTDTELERISETIAHAFEVTPIGI